MNLSREAERQASLDPENQEAQLRAEAEKLRAGRKAEWGGEDLADKKVFIEGAVYHFRGIIESISYNVIWLTDCYKVFNNSKDKITEEIYIGRWSVPTATILGLGIHNQVAWLDGPKKSD